MARLIQVAPTPIQVLRPEYGAIVGDVVGALVLNYFEQWQVSVGRDGWTYRTQSEISADFFGLLTVVSVRRAIETLVKMGYLARRRNPRNRQDRTWQYQIVIPKVQNAVIEWQKSQPSMLPKPTSKEAKPPSNDEKPTSEGAKPDQHTTGLVTGSETASGLGLETETTTETGIAGEYADPVCKDGQDAVVAETHTPTPWQKLDFSKPPFASFGTVDMQAKPPIPPQIPQAPPHVVYLTAMGVVNAERFTDVPEYEVMQVVAESKGKNRPVAWIVSALKNGWYRGGIGDLNDDSRYANPDNAKFYWDADDMDDVV